MILAVQEQLVKLENALDAIQLIIPMQMVFANPAHSINVIAMLILDLVLIIVNSAIKMEIK